MEKADSLLGPLLRNLGIEEGVRLARLKNDWHRIIGKPISVHTSPSRLSQGELLLNADSPIWIHQLSFCKAAIIEKLGVYGVRDVRFRIGKIPQKKQDRHAQSPGELSSDDALFISELTSGIGDEELKKVVKGAAEKSFRTRGRK
jgi:predicted nucleic acid-binding Zn ribbon protein